MQVRIDYATELIDSEKKKIKWNIEEFKIQFEEIGEVSSYTAKHKKLANQFLDYMMKTVDVTHPEVVNYMKSRIEKLEDQFPELF